MQIVPCHPRLNHIFICLCKVQKSGTSRHQSSDFYLFSFIGFRCFCMASCYVCGNSHSIQFMCSCVLYAITSTFSGKLIFKLKHENYWYRFASVQRTKPQLIPLPLLSSDTSMFPAQTRREDTREVMIFFNKKKRFSFSLLRVPLIDLSWTAKKIPPFLNAVLMVKMHYKVWSRFR